MHRLFVVICLLYIVVEWRSCCRRGLHAFVFSTPLQQRRVQGRRDVRSLRIQNDVHGNPCSSRRSATGTSSSAVAHDNVCILVDNNSDERLKNVATELAQTLDLPVCCSSADCLYAYALVVVPYHFDEHILPTDDYAVAIQQLSSSSRRSKQSQQRKGQRRPSKQQRRHQGSIITKPFFVDFCPPNNSRLGQRLSQRQQKSGRGGTTKTKDLLLKAVSLSSGSSSSNDCNRIVYDLTAGFGQDSTLLAYGGAMQVVMVERNPIVAALLSDGLRRLKLIAVSSCCEEEQQQRTTDNVTTTTTTTSNPQMLVRRARDLASRLTTVKVGNAIDIVQQILNDPTTERPDVCYLDPMFPPRTKSAAVKKNMQILHGLVGASQQSSNSNDNNHHYDSSSQTTSESNEISRNYTNKEEQDLLEAALNLARDRVVVKRPIHAGPLGGGGKSGEHLIRPSHQIKGSVNRWDVYYCP